MKNNLLRGKLKRMTAFVIVLIMLWSMLDTSMLTAYASGGDNTSYEQHKSHFTEFGDEEEGNATNSFLNNGIKTIGVGRTFILNASNAEKYRKLYYTVEEKNFDIYLYYKCGTCNKRFSYGDGDADHGFTIDSFSYKVNNSGTPTVEMNFTITAKGCSGHTKTEQFTRTAPVACYKEGFTNYSLTLDTTGVGKTTICSVYCQAGCPNLPHTGNATCIAPAKCTRCNQQYSVDHNFDTSIFVNAPGENKHYHPCTQEGCTARSTVRDCYTHYSATCMYPAKCNSCFAILEEKNPNNHNYQLVYSSAENDNKITESCGLGCGHTSTATLQIKADQDLVYTGEPITPMEMVYDSNWVGGQNQPDANCYSNNVEPGEATCTFTYGNATIVKTFTIEKGNYVVDNPIQNMTYDGEPHGIIVDAPEGSTIKFMDQDGNYTLDESPKYSECGSYDISYQFSNSRYNTAEVTKTLIINQRPLVVTPDSGQSIIYGGEVPELTYSYSNVAGTEIPGFSGALSISGTDAGQHTITLGTLALKDNGDFKASNYSLELNSTPVSFEIGKASGKIAIPENQTVTYDGEIVTAGLFTGDVKYLYEGDGEVLVKWYADNNGECGEALSEAPCNVGVYWLGVSATDGTNYNAVKEIVEKFSISPLVISDATVNVTIPNQTYTGEELKPEVVVSHNGKQLTLGLDYTVGYEDNVEAGQATVTISGMGNFNGETTANFTIEKADATITVDTTSYAKTIGTDSNSEAEVIYTSSDEKVAAISGNGTVTIKGAGTATITLSLTESDNYNEAVSKEVEVSVGKSQSPTLAEEFKTYVYAEKKMGESVFVAGLPEDCGAVNYYLLGVDDEEKMLENVSVDADGKITYDVMNLDAYMEGAKATITVRVEMGNYQDAIYKLTVNRTDKLVQDISAENISLTYGDDGDTISVVGAKTELTYTVEEDSNDNGDVVAVDENGNLSIVNAGTAKVRVIAKDSDVYAEAECQVIVTVNPAKVTITAENYVVKEKDVLPSFEYKVEGLVNGDALKTKVNIESAAKDTNTPGKYDIILSGPECEGNYTYTYVKGTLEILAEDEAPFIMGDDGNMGWDAISDEILEAENGAEVVVDMNGATVVPGDILEIAREKDITITLQLDNGLTWTIDGSTITGGEIGNIDFGTTFGAEDKPLNNIPVDVINKVTGEKSTIEVNLAYSGNFGFTAVLTANLNGSNAGYYANLFYYNPTTKALEFVCADVIAKDGTAKLTFNHASDYVIVIDDEDLSKANNKVDSSATTGDNAPLMAVVLMLMISAAGFVVVNRKKRNA